MTRWGCVEYLPQAEGYETLEARRPKQGTKTSKNNPKKKRKAEEKKKKTKESGEGEPGQG
jgi:hypothetical protein